jgi:hypothetical protein
MSTEQGIRSLTTKGTKEHKGAGLGLVDCGRGATPVGVFAGSAITTSNGIQDAL